MNLSSLSLYSPSSSSSSSKRKRDSDSFDEPRRYKRAKYDVFMNYSSKDIGNSFISYLREALKSNNFTVSELPAGQNVCSKLLKPVEDSDIYLVVFSSKYASSVRCLDELVDIMDCFHKFDRRKVFPVFFKVEPSDVTNQRGLFKEAFEAHEINFSAERVEKWRQAMKEAGKFSGHHLPYGDEGKFLRQIVKFLGKIKNPLELFDATHPVGIESRAQDILSKLRLGDKVFTIVAVLGIGGSGKTTIVKAVYDRIAADFDARCFIENIHDYKNSGRNWKVDLQQKVISSLTGNHQCYNSGAKMIRKLISSRKVLLVLDDVDEFEQLQALGIHNSSFFGYSSRIIVTTRNKQSLSNLPYTPYEISLLNEMESFELFTGVAFGKDEPVIKNFGKNILWRAGGLPLVLEVWGRQFKCHERKQWPSLLKTLKRTPHDDVQKQLQMSYDSLSYISKKLFLDITFYFVRMDKDLVVKVLEDEEYAFFPDLEIQNLVDKSLVKIDQDGRLSMHHAIMEMGQEVVRRENEDEPGQRTRLTGDKNVVRILRDCLGTESVEGIEMTCFHMEERVTVHVKALKMMSNLRFILLHDYYSKLQWCFSSSSSSNDDMSSFSFKKLKYLKWDYFPFKYINIDMGNVVVIQLLYSKMEILWEGFKSLQKLRILDVSFSSSLTKTGNLDGLKKLEKLRLRGCEKLVELHSSVGCLEKLEELVLRDCKSLTSLVQLNLGDCSNRSNTSCEVPGSLCQLYKLKNIDLYGCVKLKSIPILPSHIKCIIARDCESLVNLPSNISELQFLEELNLSGCKSLEPEALMKVIGLRNLQRLIMGKCNVSQVSNEIGNLVSLQLLDLSENTFSSLPDSFSNLSKLEHLEINDCSQLKTIPNLPPNIKEVTANDCERLVNLPSNMYELQFLKQISMSNCNMSKVSSEIGNLVSLNYLDLSENPYSRLPDTFNNLSKLKYLRINDCSQLKSIPNLPLSIANIRADACKSLIDLPSNMSELQSLTELKLDHCLNLGSEGLMKVARLRNLIELSMINCNVSQVSSEIGNLVSLNTLELSKNTFSSLSESFSNLSELVNLKIDDCYKLEFLPLLPSNLEVIEASRCWSLDVMPYNSMKKAYIFRSKIFEESFFTNNEALWMSLSGEEVPDWFSYTSNGDVLSFVAPMQHLDNKICGVIICSTFTSILDDEDDGDDDRYVIPTMLNKTRETSHCFYSQFLRNQCAMSVVFYPLNDTTLVVEAGDTIVLQFDDYSVLSCGLRLIYEGDVVDDSTLHIQKQLIEPPFTLTVPSSEMTAAAAASASINQFRDDLVCSSPFQDNEYLDHNFFPEYFSNDCFETTLPTAGATITPLHDDEVYSFPIQDNEFLYYNGLPLEGIDYFGTECLYSGLPSEDITQLDDDVISK